MRVSYCSRLQATPPGDRTGRHATHRAGHPKAKRKVSGRSGRIAAAGINATSARGGIGRSLVPMRRGFLCGAAAGAATNHAHEDPYGLLACRFEARQFRPILKVHRVVMIPFSAPDEAVAFKNIDDFLRHPVAIGDLVSFFLP